jgi:DNA-binding transcriptional LysR family regulator
MRAVAEVCGTSTSTVSQQIAALAREVGAELVEPHGRLVRLTPAGRRLAEHAATILTALDAARRDLGPDAEPAGTLRIAGFATAIRTLLLPVLAGLAVSHPRLRLLVREHEPDEALACLAADEVDLALTYDYDLAPAAVDPALAATPLWTAAWGLGVPASAADARDGGLGGHGVRDGGRAESAPEVFARFGAYDWIVNSRNTADETVVRAIASTAGLTPSVTHRADSLDLLQDMIAAGLGVGLLPVGHPLRADVRVLPLHSPAVRLRAYAVACRGHLSWPPIAYVTELLRCRTDPAAPAPPASAPRKPRPAAG